MIFAKQLPFVTGLYIDRERANGEVVKCGSTYNKRAASSQEATLSYRTSKQIIT